MRHCEMLFLCFLALEAQLQQTCVHRKHQSIAPKVLASCYIHLPYQFLFASSIHQCSLFPLVSDSPLAKTGWENAQLCLKRI